MRRSVLAYSGTFLGSVIGPIVVYRISTGLSLWNLAAWVLAFGVTLGLGIGCLVGRIAMLPIAIAALCAVGLLWVPVLLLSLGGAFIAFPVLLLYAALVAVGANVGGRLNRGKGSLQ